MPASSAASKSKICSRNSLIRLPGPPAKRRCAARTAAVCSADTKSPTPSAWVKSIRPSIQDRAVNSPGDASRAPYSDPLSSSWLKTRCNSSGFPGNQSSTTGCPMGPRPAEKRTASAGKLNNWGTVRTGYTPVAPAGGALRMPLTRPTASGPAIRIMPRAD